MSFFIANALVHNRDSAASLEQAKCEREAVIMSQK